ncbi:putative major facilitator, sugar transporter, major facilitator superfamily [Helianthus annuus]|nr:putative major facilitator, sugar transporter, major facilitator superfamily [Helianthus annuus]
MAPTHLRGGLNMMFQLAPTLGIFSANMINYGTSKLNKWGWRLSLGLAAAPALLMTVGGILLPEQLNRTRIKRKRKKSSRKNTRYILEKRNQPQLVMAICMPIESAHYFSFLFFF